MPDTNLPDDFDAFFRRLAAPIHSDYHFRSAAVKAALLKSAMQHAVTRNRPCPICFLAKYRCTCRSL